MFGSYFDPLELPPFLPPEEPKVNVKKDDSGTPMSDGVYFNPLSDLTRLMVKPETLEK